MQIVGFGKSVKTSVAGKFVVFHIFENIILEKWNEQWLPRETTAQTEPNTLNERARRAAQGESSGGRCRVRGRRERRRSEASVEATSVARVERCH